MCYKLIVRFCGKWRVCGFDHRSHEEARDTAKFLWPGNDFLILPT